MKLIFFLLRSFFCLRGIFIDKRENKVVFEFLGLNKRFYQFLPSFSDSSQKNAYRNMHESHLKKKTFFIICTFLIKIE